MRFDCDFTHYNRAKLAVGTDRHHTLDFYFRYDNEVQVRNPEHVLYFGVAYSFE